MAVKTACDEEDCTEKFIISKRITDVIFELKECAFVGQESELDFAELEELCCDGGAASSCIAQKFSARAVTRQTAQGGTVMMTTHVCLKTYYVRDQTGEL
jgi:hypothetical protein